MRFWQLKHAEKPKEAEEGYNDSKDSYDRDENFNAYGLFVFFSLKLR